MQTEKVRIIVKVFINKGWPGKKQATIEKEKGKITGEDECIRWFSSLRRWRLKEGGKEKVSESGDRTLIPVMAAFKSVLALAQDFH